MCVVRSVLLCVVFSYINECYQVLCIDALSIHLTSVCYANISGTATTDSTNVSYVWSHVIRDPNSVCSLLSSAVRTTRVNCIESTFSVSLWALKLSSIDVTCLENQ